MQIGAKTWAIESRPRESCWPKSRCEKCFGAASQLVFRFGQFPATFFFCFRSEGDFGVSGSSPARPFCSGIVKPNAGKYSLTPCLGGGAGFSLKWVLGTSGFQLPWDVCDHPRPLVLVQAPKQKAEWPRRNTARATLPFDRPFWTTFSQISLIFLILASHLSVMTLPSPPLRQAGSVQFSYYYTVYTQPVTYE